MTPSEIDFSKAPFLVIWETTQACDLACTHCRASAQPLRNSAELTTEEAKDLLNQVKAMGTHIVVLSGGDPVKRPDLIELIRFGRGIGLRMATIPAATTLLTEDLVKQFKDAGLEQMALSIDFPTAELHDAFRGVPGAFERSIQAASWANKHGLPLQVNTTITKKSLPYLEEMGRLVDSLNIVFWEVFFLVPVGRGEGLERLDAASCERAFAILYDINRTHDFVLKVAEAQHYRRYVSQREGGGVAAHKRMPERLRRALGPGGTMGLAPKAVNSGNGFMFVSHLGEICPSGFLYLPAGNIRNDGLADIYRNSKIFNELRDASLLKGICGACEFKNMCAGSRSRAWAITGDYLAAEPWCDYKQEKRAG